MGNGPWILKAVGEHGTHKISVRQTRLALHFYMDSILDFEEICGVTNFFAQAYLHWLHVNVKWSVYQVCT